MKRFLKKLILPLILVLLLFEAQKFLVNSSTSPFWGNHKLFNKVEFLLESEEHYDLILFGSSLTHRQLIPSIFEKELGLNTYNLGTPAMRNPETYYALEYFLKELPKEKQPKYMLLELQEVSYIDPRNAASEQGKYFVDGERFLTGMKKYGSRSPRKSYIYFTNFLKNEFKIGLIRMQLLADQENEENFESYREELGRFSGFYPFDLEKEKGHIERKDIFLEDPSELKKTLKEVRTDVKNAPIQSADVQIAKRMIELCRSRGIEPVLILPARKTGNGTLTRLNDIPSINLSDPDKYPQFYTIESSWDVSHLNYQSALEYSKIVCEQWKINVWNQDEKLLN